MKDKSEVFHLFVNFYKMVQTQFESPIKRICEPEPFKVSSGKWSCS